MILCHCQLGQDIPTLYYPSGQAVFEVMASQVHPFFLKALGIAVCPMILDSDLYAIQVLLVMHLPPFPFKL